MTAEAAVLADCPRLWALLAVAQELAAIAATVRELDACYGPTAETADIWSRLEAQRARHLGQLLPCLVFPTPTVQ